MKSLVDNDILVKGSCYGLLIELVASVTGASQQSGILGAARFIVPKLIRRQQLRKNQTTARKTFQAFVADSEIVEPTAEEQRLAAEFESSAQMLALNLDVGESQLVAILVRRKVSCLLTGDKRAVKAMEHLTDLGGKPIVPSGKIRCLEQLVRTMVEEGNAAKIRRAICAEPGVDKALSICFSCTSQGATRQSICIGLNSYINSLRGEAPRVLSS